MNQNTNERITQISALALTHERIMNTSRSISSFEATAILEAIKSISELIKEESIQELADMRAPTNKVGIGASDAKQPNSPS